MTESGGYIYVLTNPSFPEYVKIGYADNVDERVAQLNRSECTPFAFKIYATLHVKSRLADKKVHQLIDMFRPDLRAKENINGKMRIREFFAMSADEAVKILDMIGSIYGESPKIFAQTTEDKKDQNVAEKVALASERKSPFSFYKCGIANGEQITFAHDPSIVCEVVGDREISYNGQTTSLSSLAQSLLHRNKSTQGTLHFTYNGEVLSALRKRLEDEGKYGQLAPTDSAASQISCDPADGGVLLYFTTPKYSAACKWSNDSFLLLKGSTIADSCSSACSKWLKDLRKNYENQIDGDNRLLADIAFKSSSAAAGFVAGNNRNGNVCWQTENGVLLKELIKESK